MVSRGGDGDARGRMVVIRLLRLIDDDEGGAEEEGGGGGSVGSIGIGGPSPDVARRLESDLAFTAPGPGEPGKPSALRRRRRMIASSSEFILLLLSCGCCGPSD
jgi:hypothetical protein